MSGDIQGSHFGEVDADREAAFRPLTAPKCPVSSCHFDQPGLAGQHPKLFTVD